MGERKVLNKYYPADFDWAKIPRRRRPKNQQNTVRIMLPVSIRCNTCVSYFHKWSTVNSRKEVVIGETYLGIQIFRFYFKCTNCLAEITLKTDPQNSDYVVSGAACNFKPWCDEEEATKRENKKREAEEMGDAMKSLENRTMNSKQYMDIIAAHEEVKSMKSRHATVSTYEARVRARDTGTIRYDTETLGGSSILKPKFILKPRSATDGPPNKKHKHATESTVNGQPKSEEKSQSDLAGGSNLSNCIMSFCQNYSDDESD